ncbi:thioredoxin family protein [Vulcaniibacterium thermophilum]|uniref:Thioredoxin family protein n=1 Tax=Vulcaniibacterium thermophilum TaxID=1169913 RepID=A0A918Z7D4_9GAMM|nr:thioredoxin family protein [Vulcaniibacterium thermophilum]GHE38894.1 thioredoxin family protein [Vulcaniibacterium thermophilum]
MKAPLLAVALTFAATALTSCGAAPDAVAATAAAVVDKPAPAFTLVDSTGKKRSLAEFAGKTVVLEWTNHECPFVRKHYGSGNMQKQQRAATAQGVVWLSINSSAPGQQGHVDAAAAERVRGQARAAQTAYLLDPDGTVGRLYGAKTTPHMYVIDPKGVLRYAGGIDSIPSPDPADIAQATQYVPQVLAELAAGKPVSVKVSRPYGCSVKYAD